MLSCLIVPYGKVSMSSLFCLCYSTRLGLQCIPKLSHLRLPFRQLSLMLNDSLIQVQDHSLHCLRLTILRGSWFLHGGDRQPSVSQYRLDIPEAHLAAEQASARGVGNDHACHCIVNSFLRINLKFRDLTCNSTNLFFMRISVTL